MDLKEINVLGSTIEEHWYYRSKAAAMMRLLSEGSYAVILDVGAGSGFFSKKLLSNTSAKEAWCIDLSYKSEFDDLEAGKLLHFRNIIGEVDADLVLLMDVLEHVDDDVGLLKEYMCKVPHGARFLISVPAFRFLWSDHDLFLEHKRRYRLSHLENVVKQAGLVVKRSCYYFGVVFPIAAIIRLVGNLIQGVQHEAQSQLSRHHPLVNGILSAMSAAELSFFVHNRLAGLTAFCMAEKP